MDFNVTAPWQPPVEDPDVTGSDSMSGEPERPTGPLAGVLARLSPQALGHAMAIWSPDAPIDPFIADGLIDHINDLLANTKGLGLAVPGPSITPDPPAASGSVAGVWIAPANHQQPWDLGEAPGTPLSHFDSSMGDPATGQAFGAGPVIPLGVPATRIDRNFIETHENANGPGLAVQVPKDSNGIPVDNSGPTVGYGVDLGQQSAAGLRAMGVDPGLVKLIAPYTAMSGQNADDYVRANPLTLTRDQVDALDKAVEDAKEKQVVTAFDAASEVGKFSDLPARTQTALADVFYQYNINNPHAAPQLRKQVTSGDWTGALNNLQNFHEHFPTRRGDDAALLQADIQAGLLPKPAL